jgi:hypothetical protein
MDIAVSVALTIVFLMSAGHVLDSKHIQGSTKELLRSKLVAVYIFLSDFPSRIRHKLTSMANKAYDIPEDSLLENGARKKIAWSGKLDWVIFVPAFAIGFAYLGQAVFKEDAEMSVALGITKETAWWLALVAGVMIAGALPLIAAILTTVALVLAIVPCGIAWVVIEAVHRIMLVALKKATPPEAAPFSYLAALLSVFAATIGLCTYLLRLSK